MNARLAAPGPHSRGRKGALRALACSLALVVGVSSGCSQDASSPLDPIAAPSNSVDVEASDGASARVAGSLIRVPHSWPFVNWSTHRGLNATLDEEGNAAGTYDLDIELDFGDGPFLQQTTEEVICLEIEDRGDGTTDIWMSTAGLGWVTVPPGVTHYSIVHVVDAPGGDLLAARSLQPDEGPPAEFCETRPDLSATDPTGFGPVVLMAAQAGNVVSIDRR